MSVTMCTVLAFTSWLQNGCCVASLYLCIPEVRGRSRVLKRPSSFHFYNPKSNSFSEEDHCAVPLNNVTCSLWYWRRTSVSCLWLRWHETSWGNVFLHWKLWRPTVFPLPWDFCCFFWSWVWWMPWDLLWPLWKLRKKNGSRKRVFSFSYPN